MPQPHLTLFASVLLASSFAFSSCASSAAVEPSTISTQAEALQLDLEAGDILQFILVRTRDGETAERIRSDYFRTVIPIAESHGAKFIRFLPLDDVLVGNGQPQGVAIYTFPDQAAMSAFQATPNFDAVKEKRTQGWEQLDIFSATLPEAMSLRFEPSKSYTLAAAWTRPDTMTDYQNYLDGIESDFDQIGASYVAQLNKVNLQSQTDDAGDPSQITIVEWAGEPDLRGLQGTQGYRDHVNDFQKAITRFDLYAFGLAE